MDAVACKSAASALTEATASRRFAASSRMAQTSSLVIAEQVDAFDRDADVKADDGVIAIGHCLPARARSASARPEARGARESVWADSGVAGRTAT